MTRAAALAPRLTCQEGTAVRPCLCLRLRHLPAARRHPPAACSGAGQYCVLPSTGRRSRTTQSALPATPLSQPLARRGHAVLLLHCPVRGSAGHAA
eukprot:354314-Chlamydomonas_euryale.AAC.20